MLRHPGPLLIASNHPNSFLDAIILSTLFDKPIHSLARGDAFKSPVVSYVLRSLNMLPVYRTSEGVENLEHNYTTFEACRKIFQQKGIVLIFSEGRCTNEWHLRPLKKGTARLAISAWDDNIELDVLPCGINYNSFRAFGKNVEVNFGQPFSKELFEHNNGYGNKLNLFNDHLKSQLEKLVVELDADDTDAVQKRFHVPVSGVEKALLYIPSALGYLLNVPLYFMVRKITVAKAGTSDHYDSILTGFLFLVYFLYLVLLSSITAVMLGGYWWLLVWLLLPVCAWSFVRIKKQI